MYLFGCHTWGIDCGLHWNQFHNPFATLDSFGSISLSFCKVIKWSLWSFCRNFMTKVPREVWDWFQCSPESILQVSHLQRFVEHLNAYLEMKLIKIKSQRNLWYIFRFLRKYLPNSAPILWNVPNQTPN